MLKKWKPKIFTTTVEKAGDSVFESLNFQFSTIRLLAASAVYPATPCVNCKRGISCPPITDRAWFRDLLADIVASCVLHCSVPKPMGFSHGAVVCGIISESRI
jgi:hypothetical protein